MAPVRVVYANGLEKGYNLGAATDSARGAALAAAVASGADTILLGPGEFALSSELAIDSTMTIRGVRGTVLSRAGVVATVTAHNVVLENLSVEGRLDVSAGDRFTARDLEIDAAGQTYGLHLTTEANYYALEGLLIEGATSHGAYIEQCNEGRIANCRFLGNGDDGLRLRDCGGSTVHGTPISPNPFQPPHIVTNNFSNNGGHGVALLGAHDVRVLGNSGENNGLAGCYVHGPIQAGIIGNQFERNNRDALAISEATGGIVVELYNFPNGAYQGMLGASTGSILIADNETNEDCAVRLIGLGAEASKREIITIRGNTFRGFAGSNGRAVYATGIRGHNQLSIEDNTIYSDTTAADATSRSVSGIEVVMNAVGTDSRRTSIRGNYLVGFHRAIILNGHNGTTLADNKITANDTGVYLVDSSPVTIAGGIIEDCTTAEVVRSSDTSDVVTRGVGNLADYDRILGHWLFDDSPDDASFNLADLTLSGSPAYADGVVSRCIDCDGDDDAGEAGAQIIPATGDWSIAAWFKCGAQSSASGSSIRAIVAQGANATQCIWLGVQRAGIADAGKLQFRWSSSTPISSTATYTDDAWHLAVGVRTASGAELWVDGELVASGPIGGGTLTAGTLQVGGHDQHTDRNYDGLIDDVRIYRRALDWYDIQQLYNEPWRTQ